MGFGKAIQQESRDLGLRTTLFYPGRTITDFREEKNSQYMNPDSVAQVIFVTLSLPYDVIPYEIVFRPEVDTLI
jgi:short-subunit dehydrogenase